MLGDRRSCDRRVGAARSSGAGRFLRPAFFAGVLLLLGCSVDCLLFSPTRVRGRYLDPANTKPAWQVRFIIPDSLIVPVTLTSQGKRIYGFFVRAQGQDDLNRSITFIYHHGVGDNIDRYWGRIELLWEMGYQVFIYDYQGYGMSEGRPSASACQADAEAALSYCLSRADVDSSKIVQYGWSLGTFMCVHLAVDVLSPGAVILETPVAHTADALREGSLLDLPDSFEAGAEFDNQGKIGQVKAPMLMLHGKKDRNVNFEHNALDLYYRCDTSRTEYRWIDEAGHDNIPEVMGSEYAAVVTDFTRRAIAGEIGPGH